MCRDTGPNTKIESLPPFEEKRFTIVCRQLRASKFHSCMNLQNSMLEFNHFMEIRIYIKSNAVKSLGSICRFVELLWQLSLHALREVHRRTFATDVSCNPLPASLTDVAFSHAATLLPVTKVTFLHFFSMFIFFLHCKMINIFVLYLFSRLGGLLNS